MSTYHLGCQGGAASSRKAVGVCFGGGGARGNVHFGVIQAMQELGIPIDVVSGTSFGALAAAMPLVLQGE